MAKQLSDDELIALGLDDPTYTYETAADFHDFMRWLLNRGVDADELARAVTAGINHVYFLRNELLYMGPTVLDAEEVAARAGVPLETLNEWWRLLRLPSLTQAGKRLSEADVPIALSVRDLVRSLPEPDAADALRVVGACMQQLAVGLQDVWRSGVQVALEAEGITNVVFSEMTVATTDAIRDRWPAFLLGLFSRLTCEATLDDPVMIGDYATAEANVSILFVDLVEFTQLSQRIDAVELASIVRSFERVASQAADTFGGRLVKLLGDGAMFRFPTPDSAVAAGLEFVGEHPELPPRRAGLATGRAMVRQGDVFGPVVNLAARLSGVAAPGELVVDARVAGLGTEELPPVVLKGYDDPVTPYRVIAN